MEWYHQKKMKENREKERQSKKPEDLPESQIVQCVEG
jgi:hypothetical protein